MKTLKVENIIYFIYFLNHGLLGTHRKHIGVCGKGPKKFVCKIMKNIKKDIMGVKNINVSICEN
jgi:hypothetical protein